MGFLSVWDRGWSRSGGLGVSPWGTVWIQHAVAVTVRLPWCQPVLGWTSQTGRAGGAKPGRTAGGGARGIRPAPGKGMDKPVSCQEMGIPVFNARLASPQPGHRSRCRFGSVAGGLSQCQPVWGVPRRLPGMERKESGLAAGVGTLPLGAAGAFSPLCASRGSDGGEGSEVVLGGRLAGFGRSRGDGGWWRRGCSGCWRGLCCPFSRDVEETAANVIAADVCRCLQMCCWPREWDWPPASPDRAQRAAGAGPSLARWPGPAGGHGGCDGVSPGGRGRVSPEGTWPWVGRAELRAAGSGPGQECVLAQGSPPPPALGTSQRRAPRARSGSSPRLRREQLLLLLKIEAGAAGGSGCPPQPPPCHPGGRIRPSAGTGPLLRRLVPAGGGCGGERDALVRGASPSPACCTPGQPCLGQTLLGAGTDPGEGTGLGAAGVTEGDSTAWLVLQGWTSPGPLRWEHHAPGPQGMEHPGSGVARRPPARAPGAVS